MADPIANAINTFAALKGMDMRQQQFEQDREDRLWRRGMLQRQDERAAAAELRAQESFDINKQRTADADAWNRIERTRKLDTWRDEYVAAAREKADQALLEFTNQMKAAGKTEWAPEDVGVLMTRLEPVQKGLRKKIANLYDPQSVQERKTATEDILRQMYTGKFDRKTLVANANLAFADELNARGQKYGAKQVRFSRLVPAPQGDGFMAELEITKADGSTYRAPATVNAGTAEEGDHEVKNFRMEEVAPYLVGQLLTLQGAEAYLKSRGKIKDKKREVMEVGSDKGGRMLVYKDTGEKVRDLHGPIASGQGNGKTDLIELKTGRTMTLDDARKAYLATYGKPDGMGGFVVENTAPTFADWINSQAAQPVFDTGPAPVDSEILARAESIAKQEASQKAGFFSSDASDFKDYGGTRDGFVAARTQYWVEQLSGREPATSRGGQAGGTGSAFARLAGGDDAEASAAKVLKTLERFPEEQRSQQIKRFMASDAPEDVKENFQHLYNAQLIRSKAAGDSQARRAKYHEQEAARWTPAKVKATMQSNLNRTFEEHGYDRHWPVKMIGKGLRALVQVTPMRIPGDLAEGLSAFRAWARNRYTQPGAEEDPQVLAEYAKVDPDGAQKIAEAAQQTQAEQGKARTGEMRGGE